MTEETIGLLPQPLIEIRRFKFFYSTVVAKTVDVIVITNDTKIDLKRPQIQKGSQDCGLFAIAISTALLNGLDMSQITFCHKDMRGHLISCFIVKLITPFPTIR